MNADNSELRTMVGNSRERQKGITGLKQYQKLKPSEQAPINRLLEDRKKEDRGSKIQWRYALVEMIGRRRGMMRSAMTIMVIFKKKLPRDAKFPFGVPSVQTRLSGTIVDLIFSEKGKDKSDKSTTPGQDKNDQVMTPGSTVTNPNGKRFFIGQDGTPIPIDM